MIDPSSSPNLAARWRADWFRAGSGIALARNRMLLLLAGLLAVATPLRAQSPPTYLFQVDSANVPGGFAPYGVALDGSTNVYIADDNNSRILKFDRYGNYLAQFGSLGTLNGQFDNPEGVAVDRSNNIYVADTDNNRIEKFDRNGDYLTQWGSLGSGNGQFEYPEGVAVDNSGNFIYVADSDNHRIEKFTSSGAYLAQWGSFGSGNGQFDYPIAVAVDTSNQVYVADGENNRIEKFNSSGTYLAQWSGFDEPFGIAVDSSNNVYVADTYEDRVVKFDSSGNYLTQWGGFGIGNGQFIDPEGIAVDRGGNFIYVTDSGNSRLQIFVNSVNFVPPFITEQPGDETVPAGGNWTFSIGLNGAAPFSCQWNSNNVALPGATNATFTLTNVSLSASGSTYSVRVSNSFGSVLSRNAVLTVLPAVDFITPTYLFQVDSSAAPGGFEPISVALDGGNNVYVADNDNSRVVKFDRYGNYLTQWGSFGTNNGQFFYSASGIAVDSSNNVYVVDGGNSRVEKFDSNGNYLTQWGNSGTNNGQFQIPHGVAADGSNNVYVVDQGNNRVEKFDSNGNYLTQWGSNGSGNGQFFYPAGVAVDAGNNVYVTDSDNRRVEKFDGNGNYLMQWGSYGTNNGQFEDPQGIAVDSSDYVYVVDPVNNDVEKFTSNGNYLTQWGGAGSGNGQFENPVGIAVDRAGNDIYVADFGNGRIQVFVNNINIVPPIITQQPTNQTVPAGVNVAFSVGAIGTAPFAWQWTSNNVVVDGATNATFTLTNVSLSASGSTWSVLVSNDFGSELSSNAMLTVLPAADYITPTYYFQIGSSALSGGFAPYGVALDGSNNVYVADYYNSRVLKFDSMGNYLTQWGGSGTNDGQFEYTGGIAVDSSNNVYVVDNGNSRIEKFDGNGNYLMQWGSQGTNNGQFYYPEGVAVDSSNNVYVTDTDNQRIERFDSSGDYLVQWGSYGSGNGQFDYPLGITVDPSNNVYVTDSYNRRVEKFDGSGDYLTQWGSAGSGNGQFEYPAGVAVDNSGIVYVVDNGNSRVEKFDSSGYFLTQWGSYGSGNGQLNYPEGVAVDRSGNDIYVADLGNDRIDVFVNNVNLIPPIITQQPTNQTVPAGVNVTFSVGISAASSYDFQWSSNNVAVPGATNAAFTLTHVNVSASGNYFVLVTDSFGSVLSSNAVLTVFPALVTTQPASGITTTGAVLNGSVTVGPDESVVWFDWGTDTNYGDIAGATIVPGDNGSNSISAALSGIPGNVYHYRMDAANDFGIAYGQDQSFTVGSRPSATTILPSHGANGATLEALVNPEGWDTTVYFLWGTPDLTNSTPALDIGAGATALNVGSFIPGLVSSVPFQYQVVASNALGTAIGQLVSGNPDQYYYRYSGAQTSVTLNPGTYIITAYGAGGGFAVNEAGYVPGGFGAEMSAEFKFSSPTTLTLLVGSFGGYGNQRLYPNGGGGGGGSFVVEGSTPLVIAGGGGGAAAGGNTLVAGGNGTITTAGGAGGGNAGASGGTGGDGGGGGDYGPDYYINGENPLGGGAGGGGGLYTDGGFGGNNVGTQYSLGGSSFEDGGRGGFSNYDYNRTFDDYFVGDGGFGGGGGNFTSGSFAAGGGGGGYSGGGGGGEVIYADSAGAGGGGGSIIDSSAIAILAEVAGAAPRYGEIIITLVPPAPPAIITTNAAFGFTNGMFGFDVTGPSGSNVVIQASTNLQTWVPLQTNLLGAGPLYFSDPQSPANTRRFYRLQLSP